MAICEICKKELEKKEDIIIIPKGEEKKDGGMNKTLLGLIIGAGIGIGGYLLMKKIKQPAVTLSRTTSPLMQSNPPVVKPTIEENMIRVD